MEFVCEMCGEKFAAVQKCKYNPPRFCPACKAEKKRASNRRTHVLVAAKRKLERAEAAKAAKVVRKCRRCGKVFEQDARPGLYAISAASDGYVLRSYCKSCAWVMKRAARACDSRYSGVGGHGDVLEAGR